MSLDADAAEMYKIPELAALGHVFKSTPPIELTESETEYVVSYTKHVMDNHIVLEFAITNTIADQLLVDTCPKAVHYTIYFVMKSEFILGVKLEQVDSTENYEIVESVSAPALHCGIMCSVF